MKEINPEARDRYYAEVTHRLKGEGFDPQPQEDGLLPVDWQGSRLCRLTARGGTQFREEYLERDGGRAAFDRVTAIAATTAEYMRLMETAPPLKATGLEGDGLACQLYSRQSPAKRVCREKEAQRNERGLPLAAGRGI